MSEAEALLRAYHEPGRLVLDRIKDGRLDLETLRRVDAETGYGLDNIRKTRVFATRYTAGQLDEMCRLRTPSGMPLPWRHVRQLLMLDPGGTRDALQRRAAERGWSLEELIAKIPRKGRREQTQPEQGRPFRGPEGLADGLRLVTSYADEWLRRFGSRAWSADGWLEGRARAAGRGRLKERLAEARAALRRVRASVAELDRKLKQVEAGLSGGAAAEAAPAGGGAPRAGAPPGLRPAGRSRWTWRLLCEFTRKSRAILF